MYQYLLFDLDGTLLDTYEGVSKSVAYTMETMKRPVPEEKEMRRYLGPPLMDSFQRIAGFSESEAALATKIFRSRYEKIGVYEYGFFENLPPVLEKLRARGLTLAVATSKLETAARLMLSHAGISEYFSFIGGALRTEERSSKAQVVSYVLETLGVTDRSEALMIGDRENDVLGAHKNQIACCGVLCGYGSAEELAECGADFILPQISDILQIL